MLPLQQAREIIQSIREYIRATFAFSNERVERAFYNFVESPDHGMIKGPYVSLRTPFLSADPKEEIPLEIKPEFTPYVHQMAAFKRLTELEGHKPEATLLTTGTGSGKTEAFEYPILDYCYRHRDKKGIKVIILYPMNALATDQSKRLAYHIWNNEKLKGKIRAGLFIGKGKDHHNLSQIMGEHNIIEDRETIISTPPDILLTNFKMLDMGLIRREYADLWRYNSQDPSLLKFIVLDELHTYDGAQGTDVANLLRRLKLRLDMPEGHLCPIGTSATLGSGEEAKERLCEYASDIFGEKIGTEAIIGETRLAADQLFSGDPYYSIPSPTAICLLKIEEYEDYQTYITKQKKLWHIKAKTPTELAESLDELAIVRDLAKIACNEGGMHLSDLIRRLSEENEDFRRLKDKDDDNERQLTVIESLLALIAEARRQVKDTVHTMPYLYLQVQLWVRELSGIRRVFGDKPEFTWRDENTAEDREKVFLPAWYCRECGASGWYMLKNEHSDRFDEEDTETGIAVVKNDKRLYLVCPTNEGHLAEDYKNSAGYDRIWIQPESLEISMDPAEGYVECYAARQIESKGNRDTLLNVCPQCDDPNDTIAMIGTQAATIASLSVGQILSSNLENASQRKILAFTNSVQDASHDASFFEARNFRFMMRTAIQKTVNIINEPVSLAQLSERFTEHWKHQEPDYNEEKYVFTFYPADLEGRAPLDGQAKEDPDFIKEFDLRMTWQITQEYGYGAFIGRTLEKTGSSATYFKEEELRETYRLMLPWIREAGRDNITEEKFIRFVNLVLHRMRLRGGIDHQFLSFYRKEPSWYSLNRPTGHWLHRTFGNKQRWPLMTVTTPREEKHRNALDSTYRRNDRSPINWHHSFYMCNFGTGEAMETEYAHLINEFYSELFKTLENTGIVNSVEMGNTRNYALNPEHLYISRNVKHIRCEKCRSVMRVAEEDTLTHHSCCIGHQCNGTYRNQEEIQLSYYHNVYNRERVPRVYAHEHNGMLDREKREEIENSFITQDKPNSLNTLVATSTLEMGIDIGDLNCGINISVPPTTANFAQRIGRAGRKTGSALIVNYAKRDKPHDLFYYSEPLEMINGDVRTPGCFLSAKEILSRHYYAFCIDSWSIAGDNKIPALMKLLPIGGNFMENPEFFINRLHRWIIENLNNLKTRFSSQYEGEVKEGILPELFGEFKAGLYFNTVDKAFEKINREYKTIKENIHQINKEIADRGLATTDPEYLDLKHQAKILKKRYEAMENMKVLEFMTNYGLLPNYAFPETGVKLNATVSNKDTHGKELPPEEFELVRPASQGIKELAPGNVFFTRHFQLTIDGLVTTDWSDKDSVGEKRFCSECDHIEDESPDHAKTCPKCGSPSYGAASNVHKFVKIESVQSWMKRKDALADDRKDDRDGHFYKMSHHFHFNEGSAISHAMTEIPFGIQHVKHTDLTDINLGDGHIMTALNLNINGVENVQRHGFVVCRHCGKAVNDPGKVRLEQNADKRLKHWHYPYCKHKTKEYQDKADDVFEEVYLYRGFPTESIKVLLPVGEIDTKAQVAMFKAGLMLGMRDFFGGEPTHIQIRDYREMNMTTGKWDNYLVIFDTIPGGSGYLEKLVKTENFTKLLKSAYQRIKECECQHNGKDGCYHCILTYANQYDRKHLSRAKAEELFRRIVEKSDKWETINGTLGHINTTGGIEESELEERFIRTLKRYAEKAGGSFEVNTAFGIKLYRMTIDGREFIIQPQYKLDASKGVKYFTVADFLISEPASERLPIAIYLDGYRYHGAAVEGKTPRFFRDYEQRESIVKSGRFLPWTLSWEDLDLADTDTGKNQKRSDSLFRAGNDATRRMTAQMYKRNSGLAQCLNSFERLMFVIMNPEKIKDEAGTMLVECNTDLKRAMRPDTEMTMYLSSGTPAYQFTVSATKNNFFFTTSAPLQESWAKTLIGIPWKNPGSTKYSISLESMDKELDKEVWNHFWRLHNVLTLFGAEAIYECESDEEDSIGIPNGTQNLDSLIEAYDNEELNEMIRLLHANGIEINPDGYFAIMDGEETIADALLGSEELKFAVTEDLLALKVLEDRGYNVLKPTDIEKLKEIINGIGID